MLSVLAKKYFVTLFFLLTPWQKLAYPWGYAYHRLKIAVLVIIRNACEMRTILLRMSFSLLPPVFISPARQTNYSTCSITSPWMLILIGVSLVFSITIVFVFSALFIRPNFLLVSSICVVTSCSSGLLLARSCRQIRDYDSLAYIKD